VKELIAVLGFAFMTLLLATMLLPSIWLARDDKREEEAARKASEPGGSSARLTSAIRPGNE
jgi:hypothetical protein